MAGCICATPPSQTKNDTDLKFGTHTPLDHTRRSNRQKPGVGVFLEANANGPTAGLLAKALTKKPCAYKNECIICAPHVNSVKNEHCYQN